MKYPVKLQHIDDGEIMVICPGLPSAVAEIGLYKTMLQHDIRKSELARRLHLHRRQVDCLADLCHKAKLDQVQAALGAVGSRVEINVIAV